MHSCRVTVRFPKFPAPDAHHMLIMHVLFLGFVDGSSIMMANVSILPCSLKHLSEYCPRDLSRGRTSFYWVSILAWTTESFLELHGTWFLMLDQLSVSLDTGSIQVAAFSENRQKVITAWKSVNADIWSHCQQGLVDDHNQTCACKVKNSVFRIQVLA